MLSILHRMAEKAGALKGRRYEGNVKTPTLRC
jgi:hypothetical protein